MIRSARREEIETLLEIQREAAVAAFAHIFPQDLYPFPSESIREVWQEAFEDPDIDVQYGREL
jgi:hypothetical protein